MANHISAIHVIKGQLALSDGDYRALLRSLTGKGSSKEMTVPEQAAVRNHLELLAARQGVARANPKQRLTREQFDQVKKDASPQERKIWAMWNDLARRRVISSNSAAALNAWVSRQVGVDSLRFATTAQLDALIEALKAWLGRKTP